MGKQKIAQVLCRAGLHLGTTTVGRILKEPPHPKPSENDARIPPCKAEHPTRSTSTGGRRIEVLVSSLVPFGLGLPGVPGLKCRSRDSPGAGLSWR